MSGKKDRDAAAAEAERNKQKALDADKDADEGGPETRDLLGDQDNQDVIF